MDLPRREQLFRIFVAELLNTNDEIALSAVLSDGSEVNLLGNGCAAMGEEVVAQLAGVGGGQFIDSAAGAVLQRRAWDRHQLVKRTAAAAFVYLTFSTSVPAVASFTITAGTTIKAATGVAYTVVADATFNVGTSSLANVLARSVLAGRSQMVAKEKLTSIASTIVGAPAGLAVINPEASAGGDDAESDDDFRRRCRLEPRARTRGTKDAIEFGALQIPGVVRATAFQGIDRSGRANRIAGLVIADRFTDALVRQGVQVATYDAQSQAFARVVERQLDTWRAWGIYCPVSVAQVVMLALTLRLRFRAGADTEIAKLEAMATTVRMVNSLAPGADFDPADLVAKLRAVAGLDVRGDEVDNPAGIVTPSSVYQVLRTTDALIQFTSQAAQVTATPSLITPVTI